MEKYSLKFAFSLLRFLTTVQFYNIKMITTIFKRTIMGSDYALSHKIYPPKVL